MPRSVDADAMSVFYPSSYVFPEHKLLYVNTPKVGGTSIKSLLVDLSSRQIAMDPEDRALYPSIGGRGPLHQRRFHPARRLTSLNPDEMADALYGEGWMRFTVTRHPLGRVFSAWSDKILGGVLLGVLEAPKLVRTEDNGIDVRASFEAFLDDLDAQTDYYFADFHFLPQTARIRMDLIEYTHRIDLSELNGFVAGPLSEHVGRHLKLERRNRGLSLRWQDAYTDHGMEIALRHYGVDLDRLGYEQVDVTEGPLVVGPREAAWIDDLRGLNRAFNGLHAEARRRRGYAFGRHEIATAIKRKIRPTHFS